MGVLARAYGLGEVAIVAGSFCPVGGHNLLEPAALGLPVLFGPHVFNFAEISRLLSDAGGGVRVSDAAGLARELARYLADETLRRATGAKAYGVVEDNRGALDRLMALIEEQLAEARPDAHA